MAPRIFLIRHGQAEHNIRDEQGNEDHSIPDPLLTPLGLNQAASLPFANPEFYAQLDPANTLIACSPLRRTLQTALIGFAAHLPPNGLTPAPTDLIPNPVPTPMPFILLPHLQECGWEPCDVGGPLEATRSQTPFDASWLDWSLCEAEPDWNQDKGIFEAKEPVQVERAKWVRRWLRSREEPIVVVVCHAGFLRRITRLPPGTPWANAEVREYRFRDQTGADEEADLDRVDPGIM